MVKKIGVAEFRRQLKNCLDDAADHPGTLIQVGTERGILVLSEETLKQLQLRHATNGWAKHAFYDLHLSDYKTIAEKKEAEGLPLETIIGLSEFFQLFERLLDLLARPGAKQNVKKWDVTPYVRAALGMGALSHGRLEGVYTILMRLLCPNLFSGDRTWTLYQWMGELDQKLKEPNIPCFRQPLNGEQADWVRNLLKAGAEWILAVMDAQLTEQESSSTYSLYLLFDRLAEIAK